MEFNTILISAKGNEVFGVHYFEPSAIVWGDKENYQYKCAKCGNEFFIIVPEKLEARRAIPAHEIM